MARKLLLVAMFVVVGIIFFALLSPTTTLEKVGTVALTMLGTYLLAKQIF